MLLTHIYGQFRRHMKAFSNLIRNINLQHQLLKRKNYILYFHSFDQKLVYIVLKIVGYSKPKWSAAMNIAANDQVLPLLGYLKNVSS